MITFLLFLPQTWIILGILLIIADIFLGYDFFVLPIGVSAIIISSILFLQKGSFEEFGDFILFDTWQEYSLLVFWIFDCFNNSNEINIKIKEKRSNRYK